MRINSLTALFLFPTLLLAQKSAPLTVGLTAKDSVFFTITSTGEKLIQHTVRPKQTLFSMAKFYGMSLEEIYSYNPALRTSPDLAIGQVVQIPIPNAAISRYKSKDFDPKKNAKLFYTVKSGETLFNLCKRQFRMPIDTIVKRNGLSGQTIQVGQIIHMGWMSTSGISVADRGERKVATNDALKDQFDAAAKKGKLKTASGAALWQKDANEAADLYALHATAKIGSIMQVTNAASKKTIHVKVIGRMPKAYEDNTEILISPAAAKAIKALDARFIVNIKFVG